jgi:hypothetical protein
MTDTYNTPVEIQGSHSWRDIIPPHPAALLLPRMKPEAIQALGEDIKANGQQTPIVIFADAQGKQSLLDGVSRLDGMVKVKLEAIKDGALNREVVKFQVITEVDPVAYVLSANVHRRHLTTKDKRDLASNLLRMFPNKSDRQIAEWIGISHNTVKSVREELITSGQIDQMCSRLDKKGHRRPANRPKATIPSSTPPIAPTTPESESEAAKAIAAAKGDRYELQQRLDLIAENAHHCLGMAQHPEQHKETLLKKLARIIEWAEQKPHAAGTAAKNMQLDNGALKRAIGLVA